MLPAMAGEVIRCPACGAVDTSLADGRGIHRCVYCHASYKHTTAPGSGAPVTIVLQQAGPRVGVVLAIVAVALVVLMGAGVAVFMLRTGDVGQPGSPSSKPSSVRVPALPSGSSAPTAPVAGAPSSIVEAVVPADEEPEVPLTGTFEFHRQVKSLETSFYLLGVVTNTSTVAVRKPKIVAALIGEDGKEVRSYDGYGVAEALNPGESTPVQILVRDPPPHKEFAFEVVLDDVGWLPTMAEGITVEANPPRKSFGTAWEVEGKVLNGGDKPARFVRIQIAAYGADDKLVGLFSTYADGKRLEPGASSRFRQPGMVLHHEPDHFDFSVVAQVAD